MNILQAGYETETSDRVSFKDNHIEPIGKEPPTSIRSKLASLFHCLMYTFMFSFRSWG